MNGRLPVAVSKWEKNLLVRYDDLNYPILSHGKTATLPKSNRNTKPIPCPSEYGHIWHYNVVYGNSCAIVGIHYALLFLDRKSWFKIIFPLKDLKLDKIIQAIKKFVRKVGFYPDELIAGRDFKLIGEHIDNILEPFTQVSGAPRVVARAKTDSVNQIGSKYAI